MMLTHSPVTGTIKNIELFAVGLWQTVTHPTSLTPKKVGSTMPEVIFTGPSGRLEGRFQPAKQKKRPDRNYPASPSPVWGHNE